MQQPGELAEGVLARNRRSLARAITWAESGGSRAGELIEQLYERTGRAFRIGITGPPGVGKSTLVTSLARSLRRQGAEQIGVLAVDPTSPFSGGALLGDRVRMGSLSLDRGVFIRSMATRGAFGGLARATADALDLLDAFGADPLLVETVGVGQSEVEVASLADSTVVVLSPEAGDSVQAMKAGVMEVADLFVVNKADRRGSDRMVQDIQDAVNLGHREPDAWRPPVLKTVASSSQGVDELIVALGEHRQHQQRTGAYQARRLRAARHKVEELVAAGLRARMRGGLRRGNMLDDLAAKVAARTTSARTAAHLLTTELFGEPTAGCE